MPDHCRKPSERAAVSATRWSEGPGELSVHATGLRLLTKTLRPLPEKWHGLTDLEARYRQRYVDLIVNDEARSVFRTRSRAIDFIRGFLRDRAYLDVETPMMQPRRGHRAAVHHPSQRAGPAALCARGPRALSQAIGCGWL